MACNNQEYYNEKINFQLMRARQSARSLWGAGSSIGSDNEKIEAFLQKWWIYSRMQFIMETNEKLLAGTGEGMDMNLGSTVITLDKSKTGNILIAIADSRLINKVGTVYLQENNAVIWKKVHLDDKLAWMRQEYDTEKVTTTMYDREEGEHNPPDNMESPSKTLTVLGFNATIPEEYHVQEVWYHNLGICPLIQFYNMPDMSFINYYRGFNSDNKAQGQNLSDIANLTLKYYARALIRNEVKIIGYFPPDTVEQMQKDLSKEAKWAQYDLYVNNTLRNDNGDIAISFVAPPLQLKEYMEAIRLNIQLFYEVGGMSFNGTDKKSDLTATGSIMGSELTITTTKAKRNWRQSEVSRLIRKVLIAKGLLKSSDENWRDKFSFEINTNLLLNSLVEAQTSENLIRTGISSRQKEIQKIHHVSPNQGLVIKKEIDKENKEDMQREIEAKEAGATVDIKHIIQEGGENVAPNTNTKKVRNQTPSDAQKGGDGAK